MKNLKSGKCVPKSIFFNIKMQVFQVLTWREVATCNQLQVAMKQHIKSQSRILPR